MTSRALAKTTYYIVCLPFYLSSFEQWGGWWGLCWYGKTRKRNLVRLICAGGVSLLCLIFSMIMKHWNFSNPEEFKGKNKQTPTIIIKMIWWFYWRKFGRLYTLEIFNKQQPHTEYESKFIPKSNLSGFALTERCDYIQINPFFLCVCVYNIYVVVYSWFTDEIKS